MYQLKGLKSKNKDHTKFYECHDLTKKVYLINIYYTYVDFIYDRQECNIQIKNISNCLNIKLIAQKNKYFLKFYSQPKRRKGSYTMTSLQTSAYRSKNHSEINSRESLLDNAPNFGCIIQKRNEAIQTKKQGEKSHQKISYLHYFWKFYSTLFFKAV